jgi:hypothetical protein
MEDEVLGSGDFKQSKIEVSVVCSKCRKKHIYHMANLFRTIQCECGNFIGIKCLQCGCFMTFKDTERFSSALCRCKMIIYYYDSCFDIIVPRQLYESWRKNKKEEDG